MGAVAFDTFKFVNRLEEAGLPRAQAVAISEAQQQSLAEALDSTLATKTDVRALRDDLKADVQTVRDELRETKAELKADVQAVRDELRETKAELKADISRVENRIDLLHKDMQSMELRMTIKLGAMLAATAGVIIAALKMLH